MKDSAKNIYLDCGFHLGEGLSQFINHLSIDDKDWTVYTFEANPYCEMTKKISRFKPINIIPYEAAVWIEDGTCLFNCENQNATGSPRDNSTHINDGWGSTLCSLSSSHTFSEQVPVKTIDFSKFVSELDSKNIFCKMDIEGAEFPVLRKMIENQTISKITKIWIEWHDVDLKTETPESKFKLIDELKKYTQVADWH